MAGVPHRSLLRRLDRRMFSGSKTWNCPEDVPDEAASEFNSNGKDPQTSLWDEVNDQPSRVRALLGIMLSRNVLKRISVGSVWQDNLNSVGHRIINTQGETDYRPAIPFHYELKGETQSSDYRELAFKAGCRNDFEDFDREQIYNLIEDAMLNGTLERSHLRASDLRDEFLKKYDFRNITIEDALCSLKEHQIIDVREVRDRHKIAGAIELGADEIFKYDPPQLHGVRSKEPAIIYCENGTVARAISRATAQRYKLRVLLGGYRAWIAKDKAVVQR